MATSSGPAKGSTEDLRDIRKRGDSYQIRVFSGRDEAGKQVFLTGTARTKREAIALRNRFRGQVATNKAARTNLTLARLLHDWLGSHDVGQTTRDNYRWLADSFIIPVLGSERLARLVTAGPKPFEDLYAQLRVCRRLCNKAVGLTDHRTSRSHECDDRCRVHKCKPLAPTSIRKIHAVLSGAFRAAVRWGWVGTNPLDSAIQSKAPKPQPMPPSTDEASEIVRAAWEQDEDWGAFVWLTFVTGARRGELIALTWDDLDMAKGVLTIRRNLVRRGGHTIVKDTKSHQMRRLALDKVTVDLLREHRGRLERRCASAGLPVPKNPYVFSYAPDNGLPCNPDTLTHRYTAMTASLGYKTHLHALRHYSATELLAAGVDLRTVAGRLGHSGGGATTLKVYAAWVATADEQAAELLASKLPSPRRKSSTDAEAP